MFASHGRLGSAQVRWNDYVGTAAADDAGALLNTRSLYEIAGLDRDRWTIAGIDFSMGSSEHVVIYAMDRTSHESALEALDSVRVTAFHLGASLQLDQFLAEAFQRVSVRLLSSVIDGKDLLVADHIDRLGQGAAP
jgi:hypothetical protein